MTTTVVTGGDRGVYDRASEVKQFDATKMGVKGLVDSGLTSIPRCFIHPPAMLSDLKRRQPPPDIIPTIDLSGAHSDGRPAIVEQMSRASRELGLFQLVNHGIPVEVLDRVIASVKAFHEQPPEAKARFYWRLVEPGVSYYSNFNLFKPNGNAPSWRDTLQVTVGPRPSKLEDIVEEIPEICREEVVEWSQESKRLGEVLMGLLCEGLGLKTSKLKEMTCLDGRLLMGHYYPSCPQPDQTVGATPHIDPGLLTILLQDHIGGLQIKHGENWIDVKPLRGVLVINIGDALQIMSNGIYRTMEHRVLANPFAEPRVSIAMFFHPADRERLYGPFLEILSPEKPALFRQFNYTDYIEKFLAKHLDGKFLVDYYRI